MKIIELNTFAWWWSCCSCRSCRSTSLCSPLGVSFSHCSIMPFDHFLQHWNRHPILKIPPAVSTWIGLRLVLFHVFGGYCWAFCACVSCSWSLSTTSSSQSWRRRWSWTRATWTWGFFSSSSSLQIQNVGSKEPVWAAAVCLLERGVKWPPFSQSRCCQRNKTWVYFGFVTKYGQMGGLRSSSCKNLLPAFTCLF